jgi:hypothetical protein
MKNKIILMCLFAIVLLPMAIAFKVDVSCPAEVVPGGNVDCDLSLADIGTETINTFQFKVSVPAGFQLATVPVTSAVMSWKTLDNPAVVFSMSALSTGKFATIHLVAGDSDGVIKLVEGKPAFATAPKQIVVKTPLLCSAASWDYGGWTDCVGECGQTGTQTRNVEKLLDYLNCEGVVGKPISEQSCTVASCVDLCAGVTCEDDCEGTTLKTGGSCSEGVCSYATSVPNSLKCTDLGTKESFKLTLLKARISSVLNDNYVQEGTFDLTGYDFTDNKFEKVSKIASALKDYFNEG